MNRLRLTRRTSLQSRRLGLGRMCTLLQIRVEEVVALVKLVSYVKRRTGRI